MRFPKHMNEDDIRKINKRRWILYISSLSVSIIIMFVIIVIMIVNSVNDTDTHNDEYSTISTYDQASTVIGTNKTETIGNVDTDSWNLILVNRGKSIPDNYEVNLREFYNIKVDERCIDALVQMIIACKDDGNEPIICSGYRSYDQQQELFNEKKLDVSYTHPEYDDNSLSYEAEREVAHPGNSEHELGLAVDIIDIHDQNLYEDQENTDTQKWLIKHSWEHGFVLRYPKDKENITGVTYEPWHYRYVGYDEAEYMHKNNLCLEEYIRMNSK